ncbi:MAG: ATP-dependent helicase [Actinobacteria bacterium]|nr:ATP-dependent helicase [Actinomycetota bacterium]
MRYDAAQIAEVLGRPAPTPEQRAVIEAPLTSMLVVAGAGSGKTETMAARVVWLVANGYLAPPDVLGLTFTRKGAGELATRIAGRLRALTDAGLWAPPDDDPCAGDAAATVSTYHAYAGRIVADHGLRLGIEPDARLLTEAAAWQLAHEVVLAYDGPMDRVSHAESTVTKAVVTLSGELAEHLRTVEELTDYYAAFEAHVHALPTGPTRAKGLPKQVRELLEVVAARRQLAPLVAAYAQLKRERGCLDFADQVALAARLARDVPEVARQERERYRVILLDEFQDTSEAQLVLLRSLFADPAGGAPIPVIAVGDPHQSIYGWRGASATTLARFPRLFDPAPDGAQVRHLSVSWRNDEAVLAVANRIAAPLSAAAPILVRRLQPAPGVGTGVVEVARCASMAAEAAHLADRIAREWYAEGGRPTGISAAVLCRRRAQFVPVVEALRARDLPVEVIGLGGLLAMPEVRDVVALLSVAADPARGDHLMRLLTGPAYRLGVADLDGLAAWSRALSRRERHPGVPSAEAAHAEPTSQDDPPSLAEDDAPSLAEALDRLPPPGWVGPDGERLGDVARVRLRSLAGCIARLRSMVGVPLAEICVEAERLLRLDVELLARPDVPAEAARVHLDAFADAAASFAAAADRPTMAAFLAWLEVALDEERGLETPAAIVSADAVQVLTVHAAKGLEWDVVAVPGLVEGAFPSTSAGGSSYDEKTATWTVSPPRDKGWCVGLERLPYDLRGDADGLPLLRWRGVPDLTALDRELTATYEAGGARTVAEERRLAYVAFTRARHLAVLSAPVWTEATTPRVTSRFLTEILTGATSDAAAPDEAGTRPLVGPWVDMPVPGPQGARPAGDGRATSAIWPHDPLAARRALVEPGARVWAAEVAALPTNPADALRLLEAEVVAGAGAGDQDDLELLAVLRERRARRSSGPVAVDLPAHLSTSSLVALYADERAYAERLRRPMPAPPATRARAGTAFHAWVEQHFQRAAIVDLDDLPGSGDEPDVLDLADAKERFLASSWAAREPVEVELALETHLAGVAIRGRIDAVFRDGEGVVVVDWKTGRPPTGERARAAAVQLAVYRLAYSRLRNLPPQRVRAAFYYVGTGQTVYPELPELAELEAIVRGGEVE